MLYQKEWIKSHHPGIPVISTGNLSVGGTGKTPMVSFLTQSAKDYGLKPAIISRGYQNRSQKKIQRVCFSETNVNKMSVISYNKVAEDEIRELTSEVLDFFKG